MSKTRQVQAADLLALLALNNTGVPNVNGLDEAELARLVSMSTIARTAILDGTLAGLMLAMRPGQPYHSVNYQWFSERYDEFLYVDRIIVATSRRGTGIGTALYRDVFDYATKHRIPRVLCEVNLEPPNPGSLRFHHRLGFTAIGQQRTENGTKLVTLLTKEL